jgi:hypothetical protein
MMAELRVGLFLFDSIRLQYGHCRAPVGSKNELGMKAWFLPVYFLRIFWDEFPKGVGQD